MSNKKNKTLVSISFRNVFVFLSLFILAESSGANIFPSTTTVSLLSSSCTQNKQNSEEFIKTKNDIISAKTLEEARNIALEPTEQALSAVHQAKFLLASNDDLIVAEQRLDTARSKILSASSQEEVADEFSGMMLAGLDNDSVAKVDTEAGSCNYSTGETVAIVIGLILGIIPGLILLAVLC